MIVEGLLGAGVLAPDQTAVSTRTHAKLVRLREQYPQVRIAPGNRELARISRTIFICTKPLETIRVLAEIQSDIRPDTHLVSIAAGVPVEVISRFFPGKITRIIPSLTSVTRSGVNLVCHTPGVPEADARRIETLFSAVGSVARIREDQFEAAADLTSCGPALLATLLEEFSRGAARHSSLTEQEAWALAVSTLSGTARLLDEHRLPAAEVLRRVATPGGITEEGAALLRTDMPGVFDRLFERTLAKHDSLKGSVRREMELFQR